MFWKKRKTDSNDELRLQIEELTKQLESLKSQKVEYHFHIEHINIHDPKLEKLEFHLETIDVEELSGALNIGNNIGVSDPQKEPSTAKMKDTKRGYSVSLHQGPSKK